MKIYSALKKAGTLGKSLGYITWGVKSAYVLAKDLSRKGIKASKRGLDAMKDNKDYQVTIRCYNKNTGEYTSYKTMKNLTSEQAVRSLDILENFDSVTAEVTKEENSNG